ncbi:hypothetical protein BW247_03765 [Acidihalobacter ferrooxydans]|uniref:Salt-induced outer membrane protein n=1 Tax=Acidihalobacter ferrooxydans TaxID=1765967 RepID=A0A1P8UEN4_9GAMM|nr:hypothetical protein BW247_03765 [Acidihalobacter ferrooxydans]
MAGALLWWVAGAAQAEAPFPPFLITSTPSLFDLGALEPKPRLKGSLSLGGVLTSGAGNTSSGNGKLELRYRYLRWCNRATLSALYAAQNGVATARRYAASDTLRYGLSARRFLFANVAGLQDRFAGYDYQFAQTAGYGLRVIADGPQRLDVELGAGLVQTQEVDGAPYQGAVARLAAQYRFKLNKRTRFSQTLETLADRNVYIQAVSALSVAVYGNLGLQLSYTVTSNTRTPPGVPKTSTISAVTMLYAF